MGKLKPNQFYLPSGALITEHPILFKTEMVQANLEDRKNQTRRVIKDEMLQSSTYQTFEDFLLVTMAPCPYGKPGDLHWVKETMIRNNNSGTYWPAANGYVKTADYEKTIPSIHMPKAASRIWAMVEDIRVEKVQDISKEDAIAEGIKSYTLENGHVVYKDYEGAKCKEIGLATCHSPEGSYRRLWTSINGHDSWNANPWVWVIKYRILSKTGRPSMDVIEQAYSEICNPKSEILNTPTP